MFRNTREGSSLYTRTRRRESVYSRTLVRRTLARALYMKRAIASQLATLLDTGNCNSGARVAKWLTRMTCHVCFIRLDANWRAQPRSHTEITSMTRLWAFHQGLLGSITNGGNHWSCEWAAVLWKWWKRLKEKVFLHLSIEHRRLDSNELVSYRCFIVLLSEQLSHDICFYWMWKNVVFIMYSFL